MNTIAASEHDRELNEELSSYRNDRIRLTQALRDEGLVPVAIFRLEIWDKIALRHDLNPIRYKNTNEVYCSPEKILSKATRTSEILFANTESGRLWAFRFLSCIFGAMTLILGVYGMYLILGGDELIHGVLIAGIATIMTVWLRIRIKHENARRTNLKKRLYEAHVQEFIHNIEDVYHEERLLRNLFETVTSDLTHAVRMVPVALPERLQKVLEEHADACILYIDASNVTIEDDLEYVFKVAKTWDPGRVKKYAFVRKNGPYAFAVKSGEAVAILYTQDVHINLRKRGIQLIFKKHR